MTDPAPTPWRWDGTTLVDAEGKLVCILAQRLGQQEVLIAEILAAREMHRLLIACELYVGNLPGPLGSRTGGVKLLTEIRAMLTRLGGDDE